MFSQFSIIKTSIWALATALGPVIAGVLATKGQWRWFFCKYPHSYFAHTFTFSERYHTDMNVPFSAIALAMVFCFVRLPTPPGTIREKLGRMDWM